MLLGLRHLLELGQGRLSPFVRRLAAITIHDHVLAVVVAKVRESSLHLVMELFVDVPLLSIFIFHFLRLLDFLLVFVSLRLVHVPVCLKLVNPLDLFLYMLIDLDFLLLEALDLLLVLLLLLSELSLDLVRSFLPVSDSRCLLLVSLCLYQLLPGPFKLFDPCLEVGLHRLQLQPLLVEVPVKIKV